LNVLLKIMGIIC